MKYKITSTVFITLFIFINTAVAASNLSFHGINLGVDEETLTENYPEFACNTDSKNPELRRCHAKFDPTSQSGVFEKLRGSKLNITLTFVNDKLVNINIPFYRALFKPTAQFFTDHYGRPKLAHEKVVGKQGKSLNNSILIWKRGKESIVYWEIDKNRYANGNYEYSRILFLLKE